MFAEFYGWIEDITVYMIVVTLIYKLSANSSYKPYIKLFTGLLMIIIIMTPIAKIWNGDMDLSLKKERYDWEIESARISEEFYTEESKKIMLNTYQEKVEEQVRSKLEEYDLFLSDLEIAFGEGEEYGVIKQMHMTVSYEKDNSNQDNQIQVGEIAFSENKTVSSVVELKLKDWFYDMYGVTGEQVNIYLKK